MDTLKQRNAILKRFSAGDCLLSRGKIVELLYELQPTFPRLRNFAEHVI